jgi:hypothetical protein
MIFLCQSNSAGIGTLNIILAGIGGAIIASMITILNSRYWTIQKEKNLFKGLISEMKANLEYIKHNYKLAGLILNDNLKPGIFINVRNSICAQVLTSGEVKLNKETRRICEHYLVTLDHLNQMVRIAEFENNNSEVIEKIKRYCRENDEEYGSEFDYVKKHIIELE